MIELVTDVGVTLVNTNASDDMVAKAAWVSHDKDSDERLESAGNAGVGRLINFLMRQKHMSPFEHGQFIFRVDVPLFVAREFHRHRTFSYNEVSGRYTEMKPRFYVGDSARVQHGKPGDYYFEDGEPGQSAFYLKSKEYILEKSWKVYKDRLEWGIAKEQAREDLPLSLMTQFYATVNPRNLMQFLTLRNDKHALKEIQAVAIQMEAIFAETMPLTAMAYKKYRKRDAWAAAQPETAWNSDGVAYRAVGGNVTHNVNVMVPDADRLKDEYAKFDELADKIVQKMTNRAFERRNRQ